MRSRHGHHIDRLTIFADDTISVSLIVSEAVLYTNDDPEVQISALACFLVGIEETNHKLVKTTPKPRATKKSKGELVGPLLPPPPPTVDALGVGEVVEVALEDIVGDCYSAQRDTQQDNTVKAS